ncbi:exonuclease sbcCD subunit D, partial [Paraburkholderia sp. SIMBA_027]
MVLAHTFASGGITSESERDLSIGGLGAVPLDLFEGFTYTALGHLHGRQELAHHVRYSGSPLAYSFSEANHRKGAWLLDIEPGDEAGGPGAVAVQEVTWQEHKALAVLRGQLAELL